MKQTITKPKYQWIIALGIILIVAAIGFFTRGFVEKCAPPPALGCYAKMVWFGKLWNSYVVDVESGV